MAYAVANVVKSGFENKGLERYASYADRVRVPVEAEMENRSAPPSKLRVETVMYPVPSVLPKSVPVFRVRRERSLTLRMTSSGVGRAEVPGVVICGSGGVSREMGIAGWKISIHQVSKVENNKKTCIIPN